MENEKLAFENSYRQFSVKAFWGDGPNARIEIFKDGAEYKIFEYPAYRIFNISAHFPDMVEDFLAMEEYENSLKAEEPQS